MFTVVFFDSRLKDISKFVVDEFNVPFDEKSIAFCRPAVSISWIKEMKVSGICDFVYRQLDSLKQPGDNKQLTGNYV